ncbi:septal ring factor EnvC (AmiA/AmiB activator) [Pseudorhizobium tarimense]|uniref:Septal ring factor EnvC (AmiA/AmiB activator) n=1 Tax=Pseudorhizobium tarimense TaxID=1079109 RepID=A0ABV2H4R5_9HYPH|nr:murein hydrolase activator EnvC [Pseudorhizobium tarimense]MCJ8518751.1 murein hydrolase activator EnvC [Pseudorhizobium tarimense]
MTQSSKRPRLQRPRVIAVALALATLAAVTPVERGQAQVVEQLAGPANPALDLEQKRDEAREELEQLSSTITLSVEKAEAIEQDIAELEKTTENLRQALIASAARRKELEQKIGNAEERLARLRLREAEIRTSLQGRREVLAEVLAALQRMGRNPPPALLVTPEDALASVRSAILLGAVVPGMRDQADRLIADLEALAQLKGEAIAEKDQVSATIADRLAEEKRMDTLLAEKEKLSQQNMAQLEAERRHAEQLAAQATSLEGLIGSLEEEIASVREAMEQARLEEERQRELSQAEREKAKERAENSLPDKNRIAPAYAFASLKQALELPVAGDILRNYGESDGTGHTALGMTVASSPGAIVTAPADGVVVFAGAFRSYGQMIILNAGDGYHLVLAGMDEVRTRQGKFVLSGEPIAVMGDKKVASATALTLETDRPTLYIEFRKDGSPVDSEPWWAAKESGRARNDS